MFYSPDFFKVTPSQLSIWSGIIKHLFSEDYLWTEFLKQMTKSLAAQGMFAASRAEETRLRSLNVKRLAFIVFCHDPDHFVEQLPTIQEKLVEAMKLKDSDKTISKVVLAMRVILVRMNSQAMRSFWPVIITELVCHCI